MTGDSERRKSEVREAAILEQAVKNTSSSLELFREAVSNSVDASAKTIDIALHNIEGDLWNVVIQDDGTGMDEQRMSAFFNVGETVKDYTEESIGEKGLGSKTTFVAKKISVQSVRAGADNLHVGIMEDPMATLSDGKMPEWTLTIDPDDYERRLPYSSGTRIELSTVRIPSFNGKKCMDPKEIGARTLHYLRTLCATGTVKNRFAQYSHIKKNVINVGVIPDINLEVTKDTYTPYREGPISGVYPVPDANPAPTTGKEVEGVVRKSENFCDHYEFHREKTTTIDGKSTVLHYEGLAIIAGENVRSKMLKHELKQGWTQKSQMGVHLAKDFIPLRVNTAMARELLDTEYYYEFKVFLNSQHFALNADRNVITNEEDEEVNWIFQDFKDNVWPAITKKWEPYQQMKDEEDAAIEAAEKTKGVRDLKKKYSRSKNLKIEKSGSTLAYVKEPANEADVSHLLAMIPTA